MASEMEEHYATQKTKRKLLLAFSQSKDVDGVRNLLYPKRLTRNWILQKYYGTVVFPNQKQARRPHVARNSSLRFKLSCKQYLHVRFVSLHCNERRPMTEGDCCLAADFCNSELLSGITAVVNCCQQFSSSPKKTSSVPCQFDRRA